jgi:hypothetical protein
MLTKEKAKEVYDYVTKEMPIKVTMVAISKGMGGYMVVIQ